jgi:nitric oxide dioxygenase
MQSPELNEKVINIIKNTIPILEKEGIKITSKMYEILFERYPITKSMFKKDNSKGLAEALLLYAKNIENIDKIDHQLNSIAISHVKAGVSKEMYQWVKECLKDAMIEVLKLSSDSDVVVAWMLAYDYLANILIEKENNLRK